MSHPVHLILSPGTRIVTRNDANRIGGGRLVPAGRVTVIKRAECPWPEANAWRLRLHKEFDEAFASTKLPDRPEYGWANEFLIRSRRQQLR